MSDNLNRFIELYKENFNDFDFEPDEGESLKIIEEGEWEQDGKYQYRSIIVQFNGDYIQISESRSGSYHTDWYYGDAYIGLVERLEVPKIVIEWVGVGDQVSVPGEY